MATAIKLKSDIKKLKAAIASKATPKSFLPKLKSQLEKAENELNALSKGAKPRKTSTTKGTKVTLSALQKLIQKKKYRVYQGQNVSLEKDAKEGAMAIGRRESKGLKSNQFGSKSENKGNVYYEYRPNRLDVKQPRKKQTYPKLEKGGMIESGAKRMADNPNYTDDNLRKSYYELVQNKKDFESGKITASKIIGGGYKSSAIAKKVAKNWLDEQIEKYKLALEMRGVMMAKGGEINYSFRIVPYKKVEVKGSPDLTEAYYSLAFTVNGSLSEANEKAQDFVKNNPEIVSATVTKIHTSGNPLKNKKVSYVTKDEIQKFEEGGEIPEGYHQMPDGSIMTDSAHMAKGGMVAGRYYKDAAGNELRFIGESGGMGLFRDKDGNAIKKDFEDFINAPKETKLFGWFEKGGEIGGRGWGKYDKGERVTSIDGLKVGKSYLMYNPQFNSKNIVRITSGDKTPLKRDIVYAGYVRDINDKKVEGDFAIWGNELESNEFYEIKSDKMQRGGETSSKRFNIMHNVGKAKYVINYHDGEKTHKDGSPFYDIATFKNIKDFLEYKKNLISNGYKEEYAKGGRTNKDWNGRSTKEILGKHDLSKMYENNLDLIADVVDYIRSLQKEVGQSYAKEFVYDLMAVLKDGKITYNDKSTLTFAKGGEIENGSEGMYKGGEAKVLKYDDEKEVYTIKYLNEQGEPHGNFILVRKKEFENSFALFPKIGHGAELHRNEQ